jgi:hypothetical protein
MEVDYNKQEINLRRLLRAVERLASTSSRELALEATAASAFMNNPHLQSEHYKSPYVITLFKKVHRHTASESRKVPLYFVEAITSSKADNLPFYLNST